MSHQSLYNVQGYNVSNPGKLVIILLHYLLLSWLWFLEGDFKGELTLSLRQSLPCESCYAIGMRGHLETDKVDFMLGAHGCSRLIENVNHSFLFVARLDKKLLYELIFHQRVFLQCQYRELCKHVNKTRVSSNIEVLLHTSCMAYTIPSNIYVINTRLSCIADYDNVQRFRTFYEWKWRYINPNYWYCYR